MFTVKAILVLLFVVSGGAIAHPTISSFLRRYKWLHGTAMSVALIGGIYLFIEVFFDLDYGLTWIYRRIVIGAYIDRNYSISECNKELSSSCIRHGGVYGEDSTLAKIRECRGLRLFHSSSPKLKWQSLWITNIYSYAPGGGGPGGGLINDVLKVGGWGDWYHSLIKFEPPIRAEMDFAGILLYTHADDEHETAPLYIDQIIERWKWDFSRHIWWKDRPGARSIVKKALRAPEKEHWYAIEITKLYNLWIGGRAGNYGFQIRASTNYGSFIHFASHLTKDKTKSPHLVLCPRR